MAIRQTALQRRAAPVALIAAFVVAAAGVVTMAWLFHRATTDAVDSERWVTHTYQVLMALENARLATRSSELVTTLGRLQHLVSDNPLQSQRASELRRLIAAKSMPPARALIQTMESEEFRLLRERQARSDAVARRTSRFETYGAIINLALLTAILALILVQLRRRQQLSVALARARDEAIRSAEARTMFMSHMSHEIRTPLNAIVGFAGLLLNDDLDKRQREFAENLRESAESLLVIVNQILDFSAVERGELALEIFDFDLRDLLDSALQLLATPAYRKGVEVGLLWDFELPERVRGDPGRIRQLLTNLISNAIKFTDRGDVIVSVNREENDCIRFSVTDTGRGIDEVAIERLFKPFSQLDPSSQIGGTGLGLAICKELIRMMGGTIGVDSQPSMGSTFWFSIPLPRAVEQVSEERVDMHIFHDLRMIVVDDAEANLRSVVRNLASWGIRPEEASGAEEALEKIRRARDEQKPIKLALIDAVMPGNDGIVLSRLIKSDPTIAQTKIVLMSSVVDHVDEATLKTIGIEGSVTKPVKQSALYDAIATAMLGSRTEAARENARAVQRQRRDARILLVEDNQVNRRLGILQLDQLGFGADTAANGAEALEAIGRASYDLVLMDCQMPVLDGFEATKEIRRREGSARHTPVVALTANALGGDRERCIAAGMDDYLSKPVRVDKLQAVLDRWLPGKEIDPLDRGVIDNLKKLAARDEGILDEVISLYEHDAVDRIAEIATAIQNDTPTILADAAHALKSTSGSIGAMKVSEISAELERVGRAGTTAGAAALLSRLRQENDVACKSLNELTGRPSSAGF